MQYWKLHKVPFLLAFTSILFYFSFAYDLVRTDHVKLFMLYAGLIFLFYKIIKTAKHDLVFLSWMAFLCRAVFLLAIPNLSQDFYRFIWDGNMILVGYNPYLTTPDFEMSQGIMSLFPNQVELYEGMGSLSAGHYSNYPPLNQFCFMMANLFPGKSILSSVIGLRLIIIAADFGTLYFGKKLLDTLKIPAYHIFWYILNPFIIIELAGNLHFEGVMICLLVWSLYLLHSGKWKWAAVLFACSVSIKLIPLIFLPLYLQKLGWKKSVVFYCIVGLITLGLFLPFYSSEFINNYAETVGLWFQNFEFNASLYYIAREIGYLFRGWNEIAIIGKLIPIIVILFVLVMTFFRNNKTTNQLITSMLLVLSFYFFTATTIHPWYIATLVALSLFTSYKFPLIWCVVIMLSYLAYTNSDYKENLWFVGLEYLVVYGTFIWEVILKKKIFSRA